MKEYYLYFDESGNLGIDGRYFVISCIITDNPKSLENKMKKILLHIKKNNKDAKWNGYELKANSCKPWIKGEILKAIAGKDIKIAYIVADKIWVEEYLKEDKNILYNYLLNLLLKNFKNVFFNNKVNLILDNKTVKVQSQNSFEDYIKLKINYELRWKSNIIVEYMDSSSKSAYNIQAADYIANAIYSYYEHKYTRYYDIIKEKVCKKELFPRSKFGNEGLSLAEVAATKVLTNK